MYMRLKDGKTKVLTLSYDDGVFQDERLIEIMNKTGLKGTFNINTGLLLPEDGVREAGKSRRMKLSEAKKVYTGSGQEVAVHALTHKWLDRLPRGEILNEILNDRINIEREFGGIVRGMAYPFGTWNEELLPVLEICGIVYSRTTFSTEAFGFPKRWLTLNPTCHHNNPRLKELAEDFITSDRHGRCKMFYLWGHSYEFDDRNNWNIIEEFAEYMGGRDDIWYATNIEIYDYIKAYEKLITSADCCTVYNPTDTDLWFEQSGEVVCIKAGNTIKIK